MPETKLKQQAIADGSITASKLASGAVTVPAMADGVGAMDRIAEVVLSSPQASVMFSNIPQTYRHLWLLFQTALVASTTGNSNLVIRFNEDSSTSYDSMWMQATGGSVSATESKGTSTPNLAWINYDASSNLRSRGEIIIPDYAETARIKSAICTNVAQNVSGQFGLRTSSVIWKKTSGISTISLYSTSGDSFAADSRFTLYGLR